MAVTARTADRTVGRLHFDFIDGLRGAAALYVVMHHVWQFSITDPTAEPPDWFRVASVFKYGSYAVAVFIVISGYCLMLPVLRHGGTGARGGLGDFAKRRSRRILPPYFAVLGASMLLILAVPALRSVTLTPWDITLPSFTPGKVLSHLFLVHNWSESWQYGFDPPLWSIALEFQIYFVFALLLLPVWRRFGLATTAAVAFGVALVPWALGAGFASPWMLGLFALGMAAAALGTQGHLERWRQRIPWRTLTVALVVAVPLVTAAASLLPSVDFEHMLCHVTVGLATMTGLVAMSSRDRTAATRASSRRFFTSGPMRTVGVFSYSLYLVHYPVVALVTITWLDNYDLSVPAKFVVLFLISVPASLLVALAFHLGVERRFMNTPVPLTRSDH